MNSDDLDDLQETICRAFDESNASIPEAAAVLGVLLAKICFTEPTKTLAFITSFMGSFSKTMVKNAELLDENP